MENMGMIYSMAHFLQPSLSLSSQKFLLLPAGVASCQKARRQFMFSSSWRKILGILGFEPAKMGVNPRGCPNMDGL